jgi:hypothetical protein
MVKDWDVEFFMSTSQETHYVSAIKNNRLVLFGETVAVIIRTIRNTHI